MQNPSDSPYPPHRAVSARQAREADRRALEEFGLPGLVLMEHAARGLAQLVVALLGASRAPVAVVCGPGQNGGDGLGCARFLHSFGVEVRVARLGSKPPKGDAAIQARALARELELTPLESEDDVVRWCRPRLAGASVVVDALFGIGLDRDLDAPAQRAVEALCSAGRPTVSVDVPSGLDADTGEPRPIAVRADVTAAMGMPKIGCTTPSGARLSGRIVEIDIGLPLSIHGPYRLDAGR